MRICERCGTGERASVSTRGEQAGGWARAGERKRVRGFACVATGVSMRGVKWGQMCDECWAKLCAEADAKCEQRAQYASVRMALLATLA